MFNYLNSPERAHLKGRFGVRRGWGWGGGTWGCTDTMLFHLSDGFMIIMQHFFSKERLICGIVLVNLGKALCDIMQELVLGM